MSELLEKANPGIVIALCGNKVDLEERQVSQEVIYLLIKGSSKICKQYWCVLHRSFCQNKLERG